MSSSSSMELPLAAVAVHGTMVEVLGMGVLLRGRSGSGKSDLALGLVDRGHRLVADDQVEFVVAGGGLMGSCRPGCAGFIEIGALGVVNLARLLGEQAVQPSAPLELVITLEAVEGRDGAGGDRLGCHWRDWSLLGVAVMELALPAGRGRELPLLVEMAVRLSRLRQRGYDAAVELEANLATLMKEEGV